MSTSRRATFWGVGAIMLWSTVAAATSFVAQIPPFQLISMTFGISSALALVKWLVRGESIANRLTQPAGAWLIGVGGLFGYHLLYFIAMRRAPPAQANIINYLWPLLIVVFSALLPGEGLRPRHLLGMALGFLGSALVATGGSFVIQRDALLGYAAAFGAALVWAGYSVASRKFVQVSSEAVGGYCAVTALLAAGCHLTLERTVWGGSRSFWIVAALGAGPLGAAFFMWDTGMKHGSPRALGAMSYVGQVLSTLLLIAVGRASATPALMAGGLLVTGGAIIATSDLWTSGRPRETTH